MLNTRNSVDCANIDFSKAFDSVVHSKLCVKLASFGIEGNLLQWISSFLHDRTQCTKVGNCQSSLSKVISGVPQGSVLGPFLFLLFLAGSPPPSPVEPGLYTGMFYKLRENAYPNVKIYILRFHAVHPHILYGTEIYANTQAYLS